jgi:hypothetical protein
MKSRPADPVVRRRFLAAAPSAAMADVHVTMQNGRVSVVAKDATSPDPHRVGARRPDQDRQRRAHPGWPITLELNNVPESHALEVLLRAMSGYIAAPRAVDAANLSRSIASS